MTVRLRSLLVSTNNVLAFLEPFNKELNVWLQQTVHWEELRPVLVYERHRSLRFKTRDILSLSCSFRFQILCPTQIPAVLDIIVLLLQNLNLDIAAPKNAHWDQILSDSIRAYRMNTDTATCLSH